MSKDKIEFGVFQPERARPGGKRLIEQRSIYNQDGLVKSGLYLDGTLMQRFDRKL